MMITDDLPGDQLSSEGTDDEQPAPASADHDGDTVSPGDTGHGATPTTDLTIDLTPDLTIDLTPDLTIDLTPDLTIDLTTEEPEMTATTLSRPPVPAAALMLIDRSTTGLLQACAARTPGERYVAAHLAALRAAAAVLAVRGRASSRGGPRSVWEVLPRVAPELGEWAAFFAATATRRAAVEAGRGDAITVRDADDLLRDAESFQHAVEAVLGLPQQQVLPGALPSCG